MFRTNSWPNSSKWLRCLWHICGILMGILILSHSPPLVFFWHLCLTSSPYHSVGTPWYFLCIFIKHFKTFLKQTSHTHLHAQTWVYVLLWLWNEENVEIPPPFFLDALRIIMNFKIQYSFCELPTLFNLIQIFWCPTYHMKDIKNKL